MIAKIKHSFSVGTATLAAAVLILGSGFAHAGSIDGTITFDGQPPTRRTVKMTADPTCVAENPEGRKGDVMVIDTDKHLANVYLHIVSGLDENTKYETPAESVHMNQHGCMYVPHVVGAMVGQVLEIKNSDGTLHNVHALPKNSTQFNAAMPIKNQILKKKFKAPETMVRMKCDVHPWMSAYVGVSSDPFFAVSAADGSFSIKNVPAGTYDVEAWHERLGTKTQKVVVAADGSVTADFTFAPAGK